MTCEGTTMREQPNVMKNYKDENGRQRDRCVGEGNGEGSKARRKTGKENQKERGDEIMARKQKKKNGKKRKVGENSGRNQKANGVDSYEENRRMLKEEEMKFEKEGRGDTH